MKFIGLGRFAALAERYNAIVETRTCPHCEALRPLNLSPRMVIVTHAGHKSRAA